jgi:hypothetical protein
MSRFFYEALSLCEFVVIKKIYGRATHPGAAGDLAGEQRFLEL